jgi:hypothetical protein
MVANARYKGPVVVARERRLWRCLLVAGHQKSRGPHLALRLLPSAVGPLSSGQEGHRSPALRNAEGASVRSAEAAAVRRLMHNISEIGSC